MSLTLDEVRHVARLARLRLTDDEMEKMQQELSSILQYIDALQEVDVTDVLPTAQVTDVVNVVRADEVRPSLPVDTALGAAPQRQGDYFKVKAVLE